MNQVSFILKGSLASGFIFFAGDLTAQSIIEKKDEIDVGRTLRFASLGFLWTGPLYRISMQRINRLSDKWFIRTAMDQIALMPLNMAVVNWLKPLTDGKSFEEVKQLWLEKYPVVIKKVSKNTREILAVYIYVLYYY